MGNDGVGDTICIREAVDPEYRCIDHLSDEQSFNLGDMSVDCAAVGMYHLLDGTVEPLNIWDVFTFRGGVDPNIQ